MIPTARSVDHVAFTVPDLEAAKAFFVDVLGAVHVFDAGPFGAPEGSDFMQANVGVAAGTTLRFAMLRLGPNQNVELFEYDTPEKTPAAWPANDDVGAAHLCLYVDDIEAALAYLRGIDDVSVMGEPTHLGGDFGGDAPNAGITWIYFRSPWGMLVELITYPAGMAYESAATERLVGPAAAWKPASPG